MAPSLRVLICITGIAWHPHSGETGNYGHDLEGLGLLETTWKVPQGPEDPAPSEHSKVRGKLVN